MPRRAKGARLYLRSRKGRESVWVILDGENEVSTGCGERDRGEAEKPSPATLPARARELSGLAEEVTAHTLKHTCITWLLQKSVPTWQVAGFVGTSEKVNRDTYGHHSPEHQDAVRTGFSGLKLGKENRENR
jgi:integrase